MPIQRLRPIRHCAFQSRPAIEQHALGISLQQAVTHCFFHSGQGCRTLGAEQQSVLACAACAGGFDRDFRHSQRGAAAFPHGVQDQEITDRLGDADAHGGGLGVDPFFGEAGAVLVSLDDGGAAFRLDGEHFRAFRADPAELFHLVESLPHANQAGAAAGRVEDGVGHPPAELGGEFQAHCFLAFDPVGLLEGRDIKPAHLLLAGPDESAAMMDIAIDLEDMGALQRHFAQIGFRRVFRGKAPALHAHAAGIG